MITAVAAPPFPHVTVFPGCCTACQLLQLQLHLAAAIATAAAAVVAAAVVAAAVVAAADALADRCTCLALCAPCGRQGICSKFLLALACSMAGVLQQQLDGAIMKELCMVRYICITEQHNRLICEKLNAQDRFCKCCWHNIVANIPRAAAACETRPTGPLEWWTAAGLGPVYTLCCAGTGCLALYCPYCCCGCAEHACCCAGGCW